MLLAEEPRHSFGKSGQSMTSSTHPKQGFPTSKAVTGEIHVRSGLHTFAPKHDIRVVKDDVALLSPAGVAVHS